MNCQNPTVGIPLERTFSPINTPLFIPIHIGVSIKHKVLDKNISILLHLLRYYKIY